MPTSKTVYLGRHTLASDIFRGERNESRRPSGQVLEAVKDQVEVLFYAAMVCGPGGLARIDTRWIGFCPLWSHPRNLRMDGTFEVDHEANR
jgi:hypothetical protein